MGLGRPRNLIVGAGALTALLFAGVVWLASADQSAAAQTADTAEPTAAPAPNPDPGDPAVQAAQAQPQHQPFSLYAADPEPIPFEALDPIEQARATSAGEWAETDNGEAVQAAWSAVSAQMAHDAEVQRAEHASGTNGLLDVGVE
jgi:hypothetical protein